jgi:hypothetical protein
MQSSVSETIYHNRAVRANEKVRSRFCFFASPFIRSRGQNARSTGMGSGGV